MGRRNLLKKHPVLVNADSTVTQTSEYTDISGIDFIQYQIEIDATVSCGFEIQFCNDERIDSTSVWKPLDFSQVTSLNGAVDTSIMCLIENMGFKFFRISLTSGSGTGDVNAWISGNVRGA